MSVVKNCKICFHYQHEEIGDSDYGAIYADNQSCLEELDLDENENEIENFDRDIERGCCSPDYCKAVVIDEEISKIYNENFGEFSDGWVEPKSYKLFEEKYKVE